MAQSRQQLVHRTCPLLGVSRHDLCGNSLLRRYWGGRADMAYCANVR
jgi:hypothetical protein